MADYCDFDCDIYIRESEREIAPYPPRAYLCMHSVLLKMSLWSAMLFLTVCKTLAYFFVLASIKGLIIQEILSIFVATKKLCLVCDRGRLACKLAK
jgi:hypothetical protein